MSKQAKEKKLKEKQFDLGLKQSPLNAIAKRKERLELLRAKWDTRGYTKSSWVWLTIVLSISFITTQILTIQENIPLLPKQIPLYQLYTDNLQRLTPANYIYLIPSISCLLLITSIFFSNRYYNKERTLSNLLLHITLLATLIMTISLIRIINLY
ncbi:hypothetical protein K8R20_00210 [bacterium]|nr:hypothetical protein [bacterium]